MYSVLVLFSTTESWGCLFALWNKVNVHYSVLRTPWTALASAERILLKRSYLLPHVGYRNGVTKATNYGVRSTIDRPTVHELLRAAARNSVSLAGPWPTCGESGDSLRYMELHICSNRGYDTCQHETLILESPASHENLEWSLVYSQYHEGRLALDVGGSRRMQTG